MSLQPTQPLDEYQLATSTSSGAITFNFPSPPGGVVWTGSLSIPSAPPGSQFTASLTQVEKVSWNGSSSSGPVQTRNAPVQVAGVGLIPLTQYLCTFSGTSADASLVPTGPGPALSTVSAVQTPSVALTHTVGNQSLKIPLAPSYRSLRFLCHNSTVLLVIGNDTGTNYLATYTVPAHSWATVSVDAAWDSAITATMTTIGDVWVSAQLSDEEVEITNNAAFPLATTTTITGPIPLATTATISGPFPLSTSDTIVGPLDANGNVDVGAGVPVALVPKSGIETLASGGAQQAFVATYVPKYFVTIKNTSATDHAAIGGTAGITAGSGDLAPGQAVTLLTPGILSGLHWVAATTGDTLSWIAQ